jgi:hypothetical protein
VGLIEREFLEVLDYELNVTEDDLLSHHRRGYHDLGLRVFHEELEVELESVSESVSEWEGSHVQPSCIAM